METYTNRTQRIIIWVIAATMLIGSVGAYFAVVMQNNEQSRQDQQLASTQDKDKETEKVVDETAYKVKDKVTELQKTDLREGNGPEVKATDRVRVNYKGTIAQTGVKFDSSYDRGEPAEFGLDQVIPGWTEGLQGMKVGGKRRLVIPSDKAYGEAGAPPVIDPNSDLVFEIELLAILPPEASPAQ